MKLTEILVGDACLIDLKARTKKEAVRELAEALANSVEGLDGPELIQLLLERERLGSTAMGDGIAIPHARIESLQRSFPGECNQRARRGLSDCRVGPGIGGIDIKGVRNDPTRSW